MGWEVFLGHQNPGGQSAMTTVALQKNWAGQREHCRARRRLLPPRAPPASLTTSVPLAPMAIPAKPAVENVANTPAASTTGTAALVALLPPASVNTSPVSPDMRLTAELPLSVKYSQPPPPSRASRYSAVGRRSAADVPTPPAYPGEPPTCPATVPTAYVAMLMLRMALFSVSHT